MHGAKGGAPKGSANGQFRHGYYTSEATSQRREVLDLIRDASDGIKQLK